MYLALSVNLKSPNHKQADALAPTGPLLFNGTLMLTHKHTHTHPSGTDPEVWIPSGIVTVPLSDPGVLKQVERGIHLFLR